MRNQFYLIVGPYTSVNLQRVDVEVDFICSDIEENRRREKSIIINGSMLISVAFSGPAVLLTGGLAYQSRVLSETRSSK